MLVGVVVFDVEEGGLTTLFGEFFLFAAEIPEEADACEEEYPSSLWCEYLEFKSANDGAWI